VEANEIRRRRAYAALLVGGCGVMAVLALLPWHTYAISVEGAGSFRLDRTGVESPGENLGRATLFLSAVLVALVAWVMAARGSRPDLDVQAERPLLLLSLVIAGALATKLLRDTDFLGTGAWVALVLGAVVAGAGVTLRRTGASVGPGG
jgi:hypothetical protein